MLFHNTSAHSWQRTTFMMVSLLSAHFPGYVRYLASLAKNLCRLSSQHHKHPSVVTSLANQIYNSIPTASIDSLQLMYQKRAQYSDRGIGLAHPRVTKAEFMHYLESVHKDHAAFLKPIGDLEVDDGPRSRVHLFDQWFWKIFDSFSLKWWTFIDWYNICTQTLVIPEGLSELWLG